MRSVGGTSRRIKVLWLTKGLGPGGAERLLVSFAALLDHDRFDVQAAYLLRAKRHLTADLETRGVPTRCLEADRPFDPRWLARLRSVARREQFDVVHMHSPAVATQARPVLRALSRRPALIGTEHNVWSSHHPFTRFLNRLTLPLEDKTLAVSTGVQASMSPRLRKQVDVLVHGVDVQHIRRRRAERPSARAELGLRPEDRLVLTVANLREQKDYPTLLRAAAHVASTTGNVRFASIGQGPLAAVLERQRDELGLGGVFDFLGYREDPVRVLVAADVFCLSSRHEGLPIALLEALACAVPVAVTAVGGVPSVVSDGSEGRVVPPADPVALASALGEMLNDRETRERMAHEAGQRSLDFDIAHAAEHQMKLYEELATGRRQRLGGVT